MAASLNEILIKFLKVVDVGGSRYNLVLLFLVLSTFTSFELFFFHIFWVIFLFSLANRQE